MPSYNLSNIINNPTKSHPDAKEIFPVFDTLSEIPAPYLFYYNRAFFQATVENLPKVERPQEAPFLSLQYTQSYTEEECHKFMLSSMKAASLKGVS
jgi:hypothetical protein